ncbi:hypothetical protein MLD38_003594 [Melastoma candidum]|uniref:Uncharacterized protein n=1 Tax=Melastoma candidum TaxID=119954 RepID=A0ACB9S522_9MYRT|nr:hypothetical protein MLD38_003594 [Melastoma candidum]
MNPKISSTRRPTWKLYPSRAFLPKGGRRPSWLHLSPPLLHCLWIRLPLHLCQGNSGSIICPGIGLYASSFWKVVRI